MNTDQVEIFGQSLIQHGPASDRVYLMKLARTDFPQILGYINGLAMLHGYSKVFIKIPGDAKSPFAEAGYRIEAAIPGFYNGREDGLFMARYYHPERLIDQAADRVQAVLEAAREKATASAPTTTWEDLDCRLATAADCEQMAELYRQVFASYPFPIHDPAYLTETMAEKVIYAGIWDGDRLLALASAELDQAGANAEMTDFATHPDCRGRGLANLLLRDLEGLTAEVGIRTWYTIARATSFGMNITFAKNGYEYGGTLVKNTQISGGLESMNVWYKHLLKPGIPAASG
jgi:putative beta-lysine N-acetyltransferase